ncbi:MAG: polysaccharide deacetylase family protein [Clostridia bacterium]|nr:polysaccharide deacetylase family protein [Clostridia bacterium]
MNRTIRTAFFALVLVVAVMCVIAVIANAGIGVAAPDGVEVRNGDNGVYVAWSPVEDADGYIVYRKGASGGGRDRVGKVSADEGTSFYDEEAEGGTEYSYTVKAYNGMRKSKSSKGAEVTFLSKPSFKYVLSGLDCMELVWNVSQGADGYTVYKRENDKVTKLADISGDSTCSYNDTLVNEGESYEYTVVAYKGEVRSNHEYKKSGVYVKAPHLISAENTPDGVEVSWKKTGSADEYVVFRKADGEGKWTRLGPSYSSTYMDEAVNTGVGYSYTVRAVKGGVYSGFDRNAVKSVYIKAPDGLRASNYNNGISISWNLCQGADKYNVYRKTGDSWSLVGVVDSNRFHDADVQDDKKYTYTVKAKNNNGDLSAYDEAVECRAFIAPLNLSAESLGDGIKISWAKKPSATGYVVYRKSVESLNWKVVKKISGNVNYAIDYSAERGKDYTYTVRAVKGELQGSYDITGFSLKHLPVSKITAAPSPVGISVKWTKSAVECKKYVLYKATGKGEKWQEIDTFGADVFSYVDKEPAYGVANKYKLKLVLEDGTEVDSQIASAYGIDPKKPMVALTYDDGPNPKTTNRILDALEKVNGRATFFIVGERLDSYGSCIEREAALGCEVANHTYNHVMFNNADSKTIKEQITKTNNYVRDITGKMPALARAPGGFTGENPKEDVGMPLIHWSLDTMDWSSRNADSVVSNIKGKVRDGDIILMHDLYDSTADATEEILPWLVAEGYQIVTVSEMMAVKGIDMQPGEVYYNAR